MGVNVTTAVAEPFGGKVNVEGATVYGDPKLVEAFTETGTLSKLDTVSVRATGVPTNTSPKLRLIGETVI